MLKGNVRIFIDCSVSLANWEESPDAFFDESQKNKSRW